MASLRIFVAFPLLSDPVTLEWLYTGIDVLFLLGLIGIYLDRFERLGFLGLASFGVAVAALSPLATASTRTTRKQNNRVIESRYRAFLCA